MSLSRRQFIKASGVALCAGAAPLKAHAAGQQPALPVPPLLESRRGQPLFLTLQRSHWSFTLGTRAPVWGINGRYMGPTIRVWNGDDVKLIYSNRLTENVAMTIRGLQVPGPLIGGAARMMSPNADWAPVLPIRQSAATLWYQANTPNRMAKQVYNGLAGMWLVEDEVSKNLPIPNHYGVDDFPVIIQDKRLDNFGTPEYSEPGSGGFVGDTLLVNGVQSPYVEVSRGWVRLRLLNASNSRRYQLQMSDGRLLHVISGDQGFLPAPVSLEQLSLAPGERREILVDMTNGDEVSITCGEAASIVDRIRGFFEPSSILGLHAGADAASDRAAAAGDRQSAGAPAADRAALRYADPQPGYHPWRRSGHQRPAVGSAAYRYHGAAGDLGALDGARRPPAVVPY